MTRSSIQAREQAVGVNLRSAISGEHILSIIMDFMLLSLHYHLLFKRKRTKNNEQIAEISEQPT